MSTNDERTGPSAGEGFESQLDSIPLRLEQFEGPLDLLLHLIKKNEVNVYDIPIRSEEHTSELQSQ